MKMLRLSFYVLLFAAFATNAAAQQKTAVTPEKQAITVTVSKSSKISDTAAFAEVYASKVEAEADLKVLTMDYADDNPQVKQKKMERDLLAREIRWLELLPSDSHNKMSAALGRLLVRKTEAEVNLKLLSANYAESHPSIKKARTRIEVYNGEIEKLLQ